MHIGTANGKPCRISPVSPNQSVCITGLSGTGKTVRLNQLELSAVQEGSTVLVLDVGHTHVVEEIFQPLRKSFLQTSNYVNAMEGLGLGIFCTLETDQGKKESYVQVVNSAVSALSAGQRMGVGQMAALREAVIDIIQNDWGFENEADALAFALKNRATKNERAKAVYQKLWTILHCGALRPAFKNLQSGKVNILNMSGVDKITQNILIEIILHTLWRKIRFLGLPKEHPQLTIVLDEFQNLALKRDAVLCDMLRECRKFGVNFLLATQSLESFPREIHPVISQTATQLYFRPAPSEAKKIARRIDQKKPEAWTRILSELKVGECVATGNLQVNGIDLDRPLKLKGFFKR